MAAIRSTASRSWSKPKLKLPAFGRLAAAAFAIAILRATAAMGLEPDVFPAGPGRDETFYLCVACHGPELVQQQGLSRERWDETLTFMTQRHGMPALGGAERELIVDYLARTYPPRRRRTNNPFLPQ